MAPKRAMAKPMSVSTDRALMRQVARSVLDSRAEHKRLDEFISVNSTTAGAVTPLTQTIIQGDDLSQRTGNRIILSHLRMFFTTTNLLAAGNPSNLRVILFADRLNTGSVPAVTDVLASADYSDGYNTLSLQASRFKIYLDTCLVTVSGQMNHTLTKEYNFRMRDSVQYNGATNAAASNGRGALFILFIDRSAAACQYRVGFTLTYTDI